MDLFDLIYGLVPMLGVLGNLAWSVYLHRAGARRQELAVLGGRIDALSGDLSAHKDEGQKARYQLRERLGAVETAMRQMPDKDLVHRLEVQVTAMGGDIKVLAEGVVAQRHTIQRIDDFLRNQAERSAK